jgi:hypothetical protein
VIDRSLYTDVELERIDNRMCVCGCGKWLGRRSKNTIYFSHACSQRRYRRRLNAAAKAAGLPEHLNLQTVPTPTTKRHGDGQKRRQQAQRRSGTSIRISYRKALAAIAGELGETQARRLLDPLLTDRQRKELQHG